MSDYRHASQADHDAFSAFHQARVADEVAREDAEARAAQAAFIAFHRARHAEDAAAEAAS